MAIIIHFIQHLSFLPTSKVEILQLRSLAFSIFVIFYVNFCLSTISYRPHSLLKIILFSSQLAGTSQSFHCNFLRGQGFIFKCNSILFWPMLPCIAKDVSDLFESFIQSIFVGYNVELIMKGLHYLDILPSDIGLFLQGRPTITGSLFLK